MSLPRTEDTAIPWKMGLSRVQQTLLGLACLTSTAFSAIHPYNKEYFYAVGDAFIFRGGREGLYASTKEVSHPFSQPWRDSECNAGSLFQEH